MNVKNFGLAIILFTLVTKLILVPLSIKQQKTSAVSAAFAPKIREIQQKYANNRQKQQDELMKLQQQGYKPTAGCLPMLLSFLLLFGVIDVVYKPMTHISHFSSEEVEKLVEESYDVETAALFINELQRSDKELADMSESQREKHDAIVKDAGRIIDYYNEFCLKDGDEPVTVEKLKSEGLTMKSVDVFERAIMAAVRNDYAATDGDVDELDETDLYGITDDEAQKLGALITDEEKKEFREKNSFSEATISALKTLKSHFGYYYAYGGQKDDSGELLNPVSIGFTVTSSLQRELYVLESYGTKLENGTTYANVYSETAVKMSQRAAIAELSENLNFLGIPLGRVPSEHMGFPLIIIPIMSFLLALAQVFLSNYNMKKNNPEAANVGGVMKVMMFIMPFISLWIAFTVPAGAGFYWSVSYIFGMIQTVVLNILYNPIKLREEAKQRLGLMEKQRKARVRVEKSVVEERGEEHIESTVPLSKTEKDEIRRRLAEARKADALKYGEVYIEDEEEDEEPENKNKNGGKNNKSKNKNKNANQNQNNKSEGPAEENSPAEEPSADGAEASESAENDVPDGESEE